MNTVGVAGRIRRLVSWGGDYLGYKEGEDFTFSLERAGETHVGIDKGAYVVGYDKEEEFEIRTTWHDS